MDKKELHLIVLWPKAREKQDEIIEDISQHLQIKDCIDIEWTPEFATDNYTRFYGFSQKSGKRKAQECGIGNVLLITVTDDNPDYRLVESMRGYEYLNYNLFELKLKYRALFDGLHVVHTTNNQKEVKHDICMLLGISMSDYMKSAQENWNGKIRHIKKDLAGCNGYDNFKEMFYVLNELTNYAVLRNYEMLPNEFSTELHKDIDVVCESYKDICNILNAAPRKAGASRVYNIVGGQEIAYDIRFLGDDYYCYNFEKDMLATRKINENGISVLSDEYYFYSLVYHILYQKKYVSVDYYDKIYDLFCRLDLDKKYNIDDYVSPFDLYFILLKKFMKEHNYNFCNFKKNVLYNDVILHVEEMAEYLEKHYRLNNVKSCRIEEKASQNYKFFEGYLNDMHVFIKTGGYDKLCKNEFKMLERVYENNNTNFIRPLFYRCVYDEQNIVVEYINGKTLEQLIRNNEITAELKNRLLEDIESIGKTLSETGISNRNIKPSNLILSEDNHFKLTDFRFAVSADGYKEFACLLNSKSVLENLGGEFAFGRLCWDDFYSLDKILQLLNLHSDFITQNIGCNVAKTKIENGNNKPIGLLQKIFSVKNEYHPVTKKKRKIIRILGIKIKL